MAIEKKIIQFIIQRNEIIHCAVALIEPNDSDVVEIQFEIHQQKFHCKNDNFFAALLDVRKALEQQDMQICCNGAAKNVYPSSMQLSMGSGDNAYRLTLGQPAKIADVVNIFDYDANLEYVSIAEQKQYYDTWLKSLV